jgi:hypothetical protein
MIQETMCSGEKVVEVLNSWIKDWSLCSLDSVGLYRGLLSSWIPHLKAIYLSKFPSCIAVQVMDKMLNFSLKLINVYGLYSNKCPFWKCSVGWAL